MKNTFSKRTESQMPSEKFMIEMKGFLKRLFVTCKYNDIELKDLLDRVDDVVYSNRIKKHTKQSLKD